MYSDRLWLEFYGKLAFLLYSIAASDKRVAREEINRLKQILRTKWLDLENSRDEFGSEAAYQIESVFDWLLENAPSVPDAFREFQAFVKENPGFMNKALKSQIMETADQIAAAFSGRNKAELTILYQLERLLRES